MLLTGGGAQLRNIDVLLSKVTGVPAFVAEESIYCVAKGTGVILDNLEVYKRALI